MKKIMLGRLQPRFVHLVKTYLGKHDLSQKELADVVDIPEPHISNLMTFNGNGYKRVLSCNYLYTFIVHEVIRMEEIYDGNPQTTREKEAWQVLKCLGDRPLQRKIAKLKERGFDLDAVLDGLLKSTEPK